tara:strand:+ start:524 stop:1204 length:681 start_codon:yes stop_codon:yes gene_type:complete
MVAIATLISSLLMLGCGKGSSDGGNKAAGKAKSASALDALNSASTTEEKIAAIGKLKDVSGSASKEVGAKAVEMLKDAEAEVRTAALNLISQIKYNDPAAITALSGLFKDDSDVEVKKAALSTLKDIGAAEDHVKLAKEGMSSSDEDIKEFAVFQLSEAGPAAESALAELETALDSKSMYQRMYAAMALGNIGSKAASAKPKLEALTSDKESDVAAAAKEALGKIE